MNKVYQQLFEDCANQSLRWSADCIDGPIYGTQFTAEQLCCKSSLSSRNLRRTPRFLLSDHRIKDDQEFTHAGRESYLL
ncbi:MAG TPA: hypothetical protein VJ810_00340, partial [Blastocatellia bacterium]|nr:hypothetical protein [Blastocatellia bacterium]